jgi:hypothetical protein
VGAVCFGGVTVFVALSPLADGGSPPPASLLQGGVIAHYTTGWTGPDSTGWLDPYGDRNDWAPTRELTNSLPMLTLN